MSATQTGANNNQQRAESRDTEADGFRERGAGAVALRRLGERGDLSTRDKFDPQVEFVRISGEGVGQAGEWRGVDEMWAAIAEWLRSWEGVRAEAERIVDLGDRGLVLARQSGKGKRSGVPMNVESSDIFTVHGGRIVRWELYVDRAKGLRAAGLGRLD